jgi:hypothetical protein
MMKEIPENTLVGRPATSEEIANSENLSKGLGDTIAKITEAVGIKPCGSCEKRKKLLNRIVPY